MPKLNSELQAIFMRHQLRLTEPRLAIFEAFRSSEDPVSISRVVEMCPKVDRTSVYRTIELFTKLRIIDPVPVGWKQHYELTSPFRSHHHHLYCISCGELIDVHSKQLEQLVASIAREQGFSSIEHKFEISGTCRDCRDGSRKLA